MARKSRRTYFFYSSKFGVLCCVCFFPFFFFCCGVTVPDSRPSSSSSSSRALHAGTYYRNSRPRGPFEDHSIATMMSLRVPAAADYCKLLGIGSRWFCPQALREQATRSARARRRAALWNRWNTRIMEGRGSIVGALCGPVRPRPQRLYSCCLSFESELRAARGTAEIQYSMYASMGPSLGLSFHACFTDVVFFIFFRRWFVLISRETRRVTVSERRGKEDDGR